MRIEWLAKNNTSRVVLFFNGWGMDKRVVGHLNNACDVAVLSDYRSLEIPDMGSLKNYKEMDVIAWSMGVWAAANSIETYRLHPQHAIALNGTERPVDDCYGIPCKIYRLTENGMNEQGYKKFLLRIFGDGKEKFLFVEKPLRKIEEMREELELIRKQSGIAQKMIKWDRVYISEKDLIFPVAQQTAWWKEKTMVRFLEGGHYPFGHFKDWDTIIKG